MRIDSEPGDWCEVTDYLCASCTCLTCEPNESTTLPVSIGEQRSAEREQFALDVAAMRALGVTKWGQIELGPPPAAAPSANDDQPSTATRPKRPALGGIREPRTDR
jgi:hypothetical protein